MVTPKPPLGLAASVIVENKMPTEATQALAQFAATLQYDQIPERVREQCKNLLLDTLACAVAGHQGEETGQITALAAALAQSHETSVIGGDRLSLAGATVLNGFLITAVTMCDAHTSTMTHITPEVVPPALAIAERDGASGRDLLVALVAGMETMTRIGIGTVNIGGSAAAFFSASIMRASRFSCAITRNVVPSGVP